MEKIASFTIDHIKLRPGVYVSRKDKVGAETITTFDLRMTSPNDEPVMNTAEVHTIEHLGATFLRNHPQFREKTIYFGRHGLPHRLLSSAGRRLYFPGYRSPDAGNVYLYPGLSG